LDGEEVSIQLFRSYFETEVLVSEPLCK